MGTQHAHRVVVKKNTSTEHMCNKNTCNNTEENTESTESLVNKISGLHKHPQQQLNGRGCM